MSVDARIRRGLTTIDEGLPSVDTLGAYATLERDVARSDRRRQALLGAAAAAVLAVATGALLLSQLHRDDVSPAPAPGLPNRVTVFAPNGRVSFVASDGSRESFPATHIDRFALSPNGRQVAYTSARNAHAIRQLWIATAEGADPRRLAAGCAGCQPGYGVTWSHDGARLAYVVWTPGQTPSQLRVRDLATGHEQVFEMPAGLEPRGPSFSPDDRTLAMTMVGATGQYVATLKLSLGTSSLTHLSRMFNQVVAPSWSHDGRTVYFTATTTGASSNDVGGSNDLYAVGADGSGLRQITRAAPGVRFFGAVPYQHQFLISRAVGAGPWVVGWLSRDGTTFTPMKGPDGRPVLGNAPQLQAAPASNPS